jgi:hypothetical protein
MYFKIFYCKTIKCDNVLMFIFIYIFISSVPKSGDLCWRPVSEGGDLEVLRIDGVPSSMVNVADLRDAKFWESLPLQEPQQTVV